MFYDYTSIIELFCVYLFSKQAFNLTSLVSLCCVTLGTNGEPSSPEKTCSL